MGAKEQAVNENVIREKEMGNGERETIKLRSPVRVSLELFHIFLYCIFVFSRNFILRCIFYIGVRNCFKKRIRCLSKKPMMHTKVSTHLTNSVDTSGRFRPTTDICIRYQTVLFDFDHWRSFSDGSVRPWTFTFVFLRFHPISKLLRPFPVGSFRFKTRCDSYLTGPTFRIGTVRSNFRLAGVYKDSRLGTNNGNPTWRHVWKNNIYKTWANWKQSLSFP